MSGFNSRPVFLLGIFFILAAIALILSVVSARAEGNLPLPATCGDCMKALQELKTEGLNPDAWITADYLYEDMKMVAEHCKTQVGCSGIDGFMAETLAEFKKTPEWVGTD